eukprot:4851832-Amphidinium_carterae.1
MKTETPGYRRGARRAPLMDGWSGVEDFKHARLRHSEQMQHAQQIDCDRIANTIGRDVSLGIVLCLSTALCTALAIFGA